VPEVEVSFCVVNTSQRELLLRGLDAIARERAALPFATEALVLDNGSRDGSAEAARAHPAVDEVIALGERRGKALNDSELMQRARGRYALLLNEDSELLPGATLALWQALQARPDAACAGAQLLRPGGDRLQSRLTAADPAPPAVSPGVAAADPAPPAVSPGVAAADSAALAVNPEAQACAWRFPTVATALAGAVFAHRLYTVQSKGERTREVDWCQSSALLVRREAAMQVGYMDPDFFVYSDEVDFARRLRDAGWRSLYVPGARAIHHEQLSTGAVPERRIVEMARNRDRYMRKHHSPAAARAVRWLTAWSYAVRALAALLLPGRSPRRYWRHVTATLCPDRGEGLREAAAEYNLAGGAVGVGGAGEVGGPNRAGAAGESATPLR
jgi:N-acetylglucosaminyl-diphospho-decaprenol L-rhamnosyltransferase